MHFCKDFKNKRRISIEPVEDATRRSQAQGAHPVQEGDFIQKGEYIMAGNPPPQTSLAIMGIGRSPTAARRSTAFGA